LPCGYQERPAEWQGGGRPVAAGESVADRDVLDAARGGHATAGNSS